MARIKRYCSGVFLIVAAVLGFVPVSSQAADAPRVTVRIADVKIAAADTLVAVPVYISHPKDTLAGIEIHFKIAENPLLSFASTTTSRDGFWRAADTAGGMMSGWEWVGVNSLDTSVYDLKVAGMADWPDQKKAPPAIPRDEELLVTLYLRHNPSTIARDTVRFNIDINPGKTGFSDPGGNSIGIVTTQEKKCRKYEGDSCVSWQTVLQAKLDSTIVKLINGSVTIIGGKSGGK